MTKAFSPFFSPPAPVEPEDPDEDVELLEELLHAASTEHATSSTAGPKKARLRERLITESFQLRGEKTNTGWPGGCGPHAGGDRTPGGGALPGPGRAGAREAVMADPRGRAPGPQQRARPGEDGR